MHDDPLCILSPSMGCMMEEDKSDDDQIRSGWVAMWQSLAQITLMLVCLAYCCRTEIVEILR